MDKFLKRLYGSLGISPAEMRMIVRNFHSEMDKGLSGRKSSLNMIPTYVDKPSGCETGKFIALDLGGTNFRVLEVTLKGNGLMAPPMVKVYALDKSLMTGEGKKFFDFLAGCIKNFIEEKRLDKTDELKLGFTFSFPVEQTGLASGRLVRWTKGFSVKGVAGHDVVKLLGEALGRAGVNNVKVATLANDTVGTLAALAYQDKFCDIGIILGTGTNACYREKISNITKWRGPASMTERMIINTEWGNFNKLRLTAYDRLLDRGSTNPGEQILEKAVSGMYLGEFTRLVLADLAGKNIIFPAHGLKNLYKKWALKTEYMSEIESDTSNVLVRTKGILGRMGISGSTLKERRIIKKVCLSASRRAAYISAAAMAAVVTKIDRRLSEKHTIAIDGSVYEKHPHFSDNIKGALKKIFGSRSSNIRLVLAKDGSGKGAAVIAAAS